MEAIIDTLLVFMLIYAYSAELAAIIRIAITERNCTETKAIFTQHKYVQWYTSFKLKDVFNPHTPQMIMSVIHEIKESNFNILLSKQLLAKLKI